MHMEDQIDDFDQLNISYPYSISAGLDIICFGKLCFNTNPCWHLPDAISKMNTTQNPDSRDAMVPNWWWILSTEQVSTNRKSEVTNKKEGLRLSVQQYAWYLAGLAKDHRHGDEDGQGVVGVHMQHLNNTLMILLGAFLHQRQVTCLND